MDAPDHAGWFFDHRWIDCKASTRQVTAGLEDRVDSHWGRIFAGAAVSTLLGVNAHLVAQDQSVNSGSVTVAIRQSSQDSLNQVGQQITRKNLNVQPTLTIRPGFQLRIIVNKDLILRPYVQAQEPKPAS